MARASLTEIAAGWLRAWVAAGRRRTTGGSWRAGNRPSGRGSSEAAAGKVASAPVAGESMAGGAGLEIDVDIARLLVRLGECWGCADLPSQLSIRFSRRFRQGLGSCRPRRGAVGLNSRLLDPALRDLLLEVVGHEAAHFVAWQQFGPRVRAHGAEWRRLMEIAGFPPRRVVDDERLRGKLPARRRRRRVRYTHRCPVCETAWYAYRPMRLWRCRSCLDSGRDGRLTITSRRRLGR